MNIIKFKLIDIDGTIYETSDIIHSTKIDIDDEYILYFCKKGKIKNLKACFLTVGVTNVAIIIENYTLTKTIHINGFYDVDSCIKYLLAVNVDLHVTSQEIRKLQVDCESIILADCKIEEFDFGFINNFRKMIGNKDVTKLRSNVLDLRNVEIKTLNNFAECKRINIQGSRISEMENRIIFSHNASVELLHIWENTTIDKLTLVNTIKKLIFDTISIDRLYGHSSLEILQMDVSDTIIQDCYHFQEKTFKASCYDSWRWISKSAQNIGNMGLRSDANYQMIKCSYNMRRKSDKLISKVFDLCAGYGYKPQRIFGTSFFIVLINTILFSAIEFFSVLCEHSIQINSENTLKCIQHIWDNFLMSIAAFAGQSNLSVAEGVIYWLSILESLLGVVMFAMLVNAVYLRYKE